MPNPSVTYNLRDGTEAAEEEVNTNFTDVLAAMTDGTKDYNVNSLDAVYGTFNGAVGVGGTFRALGNVTVGATNTQFGGVFKPSVASANSLGSTALPYSRLFIGQNISSGEPAANAIYGDIIPKAGGTISNVSNSWGADSPGARTLYWSFNVKDITWDASDNPSVVFGTPLSVGAGGSYFIVVTGIEATATVVPDTRITAMSNTGFTLSAFAASINGWGFLVFGSQ